MYFPSEQLSLFIDGYSEIALLTIDKKLDIDVEILLTVESLGMNDRLKRKFRKYLAINRFLQLFVKLALTMYKNPIVHFLFTFLRFS